MKICPYLKAWANTPGFRWCPQCKERHNPNEICLSGKNTTYEEQTIIQGLLDQNLCFQWDKDGEQSYQKTVFNMCRYLLLDQDHIIPIFLNSLHPDYVNFPQYEYLELIYEMTEARYDVLASFLLDYFNKHALVQFVPQALLYRAGSVTEFLSSVRSLPNGLAIGRKDHASAIHNSR